jgi:hypothetical protein
MKVNFSRRSSHFSVIVSSIGATDGCIESLAPTALPAEFRSGPLARTLITKQNGFT